MQRRLRRVKRGTLLRMILGIIILIVVSFMMYYILVRKIKKQYGSDVTVLTNELHDNVRWVYEAKNEISAGDVISKDVVSYHEAISSENQSLYISESELGKVAAITIPKGTYIERCMISTWNDADHVREVMYQCININSNLAEGEFVDVRLSLPNGEDYIVLSKQRIKELSEDKITCYLWMREDEIQFMSSAIVDAYLYEGAYLYTTRYIEAATQDASTVTYQPSLETISLIETNENILHKAELKLNEEVRKLMELRLLQCRKDITVEKREALCESKLQSQQFIPETNQVVTYNDDYVGKEK